MFKRFICILLSLSVILSCGLLSFAQPQPNFQIKSETALLVNTDTGTVVYEKNADKKMYTTAFNKIMTAILAFENTEDITSEIVTVSSSALEDEDLVFNSSGIEAGENISMHDLIAAVVIGSANDCCNVIAEKVAGSVSAFVKMMNDKAKEIGCTSTNFTNTHGMHNDNQYTTCRDMEMIVEHAMSIPGFVEMTEQTSYTLQATNKNEERKVKTNNALMLSSGEYYYSPVKGIKYGYTDEGGRCIATTASKDGYNYVLILMGGPSKDSAGNKLEKNVVFEETRELYKWAFSTFEIREVVSESTPVAEVKVTSSWDTDNIHAMPESNFIAFVQKKGDEKTKIEYVLELPESVEAPVKKGQILGNMQIVAGEVVLGNVNLIATESVEKSEYIYVLEKIKSVLDNTYFKIAAVAIVVLTAAYLIIAIVSNMSRKKKGGNSAKTGGKRRKNR